MNSSAKSIVLYTSLLSVGIFFTILGLYNAKSFFVLIVIAILLAMVVLPIANRLEKWGLSRGLSALISDLLILAVCVGIISLVSIQAQGIASDWPKYQQKLQPRIEKAQKYIKEKTGISIKEQIPLKSNDKQEKGQNQDQQSANQNESGGQNKEETAGKQEQSGNSSGGKLPSFIGKAFSATFSFFGDFLLIFVYIFFFLFYRQKFHNVFLKFFKKEEQAEAEKILKEFAEISQNYMFGRFLLIVILAILYSIGLTIVGIQHAILIAVLAAVLSLLPYIGNMIGFGLALLMALLVQGGWGSVVGVTVVFTVAQFFESYFLEPFIVGEKVNINPVLVIVGVVAGGAFGA